MLLGHGGHLSAGTQQPCREALRVRKGDWGSQTNCADEGEVIITEVQT